MDRPIGRWIDPWSRLVVVIIVIIIVVVVIIVIIKRSSMDRPIGRLWSRLVVVIIVIIVFSHPDLQKQVHPHNLANDHD